MRKVRGIVLLLSVCCFCGCSAPQTEVVCIERAPYERLAYRTVEVQRGELQPELSIRLQADAERNIDYCTSETGLVLEQIHVSVGDEVQAGQLLVSFQADALLKELEQHREALAQNQLLLEHYRRLMQIDREQDYGLDVKRLQQEMEVDELYIAEIEAEMAGYRIVAETDGVILRIGDLLQGETCIPGRTLVRQFCGTGSYTAYTTEEELFEVGAVYRAKTGSQEYPMELVSMEEGTLTFVPAEDLTALASINWLTLTVQQPVIADCVYVEANAVCERRNRSYVYVVDEEGYRRAVTVEAGELVGTYRIIDSGLEGGEVVAMP